MSVSYTSNKNGERICIVLKRYDNVDNSVYGWVVSVAVKFTIKEDFLYEKISADPFTYKSDDKENTFIDNLVNFAHKELEDTADEYVNVIDIWRICDYIEDLCPSYIECEVTEIARKPTKVETDRDKLKNNHLQMAELLKPEINRYNERLYCSER